jgi:glucose/arabinose dehydrogenase
MYVSIGSSSNDYAGEDCRRATIMEFDPDGKEGRIYASGLRNPLGMAWQPNADVLWTTVTEREGPDYGENLVPDFATSLTDGGFYGWPYAYIGKHYFPKYLGGQAQLVRTTLTPDVLFPAHSAPMGLTFYAPPAQLPRAFPVQYWGLFVALHGSNTSNAAPNGNASTARGFKVVFVPFQGGKAVASSVVDFLIGFLVNDGTDGKPVTYWGRPTALALANDGSLLVLDDADPSNANNSNSRLWKVTYNGAPPAAAP